jgi:hypothetical protein
MNEDTINQFDEQAAEKDTVNQFEQETGKSKVFNKRTLIIGTLIGISVPVAFFWSLDYFDKNTPATQSYQYVLGEHLKVNRLNNPKGKTKQANKTEQPNKTKQAYKIKQANRTEQANKTKQANKALATATTTINPKNSHKNSPKNTTKTTTLKAKINKTHQNNQNNQAQIEGLYNKTQASLNTLLESQERHRETQERHRNEIALKVDQLQANTKKTISQFIKKMSALFNQQATKTVKPKPEPKVNPKAKLNPLKQTNTTVFELVDISLWDDKPQATIRYQGKTSIVDVKSIRIGWKIINIDFDKEQITIAKAKAKNGQQITLEKIR